MANTVVAASLTLDSKPAETSVKSFKTQLREATNELINLQEQFGPTSEEALAAARNVAQLRDRMQEAREVTELFDPGKRFQVLGNVLRTTVGGVTALTGAMALFGAESEDVQKSLLKVQAALAVTEGLNTIVDSAKDFERLKAVAVDAFNSIKVAIGETGIGAILLAVGALVMYWDDIKTAIGLASEEQKKAVETATKQYEIEKDKLDIIQSQNNIYKEQGKTQAQILEIQNKQLESTITAAEKQLEAQQVISDNAVTQAIKLRSFFATLAAGQLGFIAKLFGDPVKIKADGDKAIQAMQLELTKMKDQVASNNMSIVKETADFNQKIRQLNLDSAEAAITDQYVLSQRKLKDQLEADKAQTMVEVTNIDQRNQIIAALENKYRSQSAALALSHRRELDKTLRGLANAAANDLITDQELLNKAKLKQDYEEQVIETKQTVQNVTERNKILLALRKKYNADLAAITTAALKDVNEKLAIAQNEQYEANKKQQQADFANAKAGALQNYQDTLDLYKEIGNSQLDAAGQQAAAEMDILDKQYAERVEKAKGNEEAIKTITKDYERQKTAITKAENMQRLSIVSGVLGQASDLFGKATAAGKVLAIAQTTIDTYQSATAAYKSLAGIPIIGPGLGIAAAAVAVASGLANVKKITSVQVPGGDGASSISASASAPLALTPQISTTQLPQQQIDQIGNAAAPVKAFVVESDITNSQSRITRLNRQARLGN